MAELETKDAGRSEFVPSEGLSTAGTLLGVPTLHRGVINPNAGITTPHTPQPCRITEAKELLAIHGRNELTEKTKSKFRIYLDQVWLIDCVCSTRSHAPTPPAHWADANHDLVRV